MRGSNSDGAGSYGGCDGKLQKGATSVCAMARNIGADVVPIDVGVARDVDGVINKKISYGTKNMLHEKAMTYEQAEEAVQVGIDCVKNLAKKAIKSL